MKIAGSFLRIQNDKNKIEELDKYSDGIHFDVMDGIFTSDKTLSDKNLIENTKSVSKNKDIHLMVVDIKKYIDIYEKIRPEYITFHYEATNTHDEIIDYIRSKKIKVGMAINPSTDVKLIDRFLPKLDLVLVMSVNAGKGGQKFIDITDKIDYLYYKREKNNLNFIIEVDGGINNETITKIKKVDRAVVGSYITNSEDYQRQIFELKKIALQNS